MDRVVWNRLVIIIWHNNKQRSTTVKRQKRKKIVFLFLFISTAEQKAVRCALKTCVACLMMKTMCSSSSSLFCLHLIPKFFYPSHLVFLFIIISFFFFFQFFFLFPFLVYMTATTTKQT
jgi:hypothetical protein